MNKKIVALTGVVGGIGSELTKQFIGKGYHVVGIDINSDKIDKFKEIYGDKFSGLVCDVSKKDDLLEVCNIVKRDFGTPEIWFNNAGVVNIESFEDISEEQFDLTIDINLKAVVYATRFWIEEMESAGGGTVVNMASVAGHLPSPNLSSYVTSKFALVGFTESLQMELELKNSSVNLLLVSPGFVNTDIISIGEKNGYPKKLEFLVSKPDSCAKKIIEGVLKKEKSIWPTLNGNALMAMKRVSPKLASFFSKRVVNSGLHISSKKR